MTHDLYQAHVLDHAKHPRYFGLLPKPAVRATSANPSCGDTMEYSLQLNAEGRIEHLGWQGEGCAISRAAASMLAEHALGKPDADLRAMTVEDMTKLLAVPLNPARLKCATLGLETLQRALAATA